MGSDFTHLIIIDYHYEPERRARSAPRQDFIEPLPLPPELEEEVEEEEDDEYMDYVEEKRPKDRRRGGKFL